MCIIVPLVIEFICVLFVNHWSQVFSILPPKILLQKSLFFWSFLSHKSFLLKISKNEYLNGFQTKSDFRLNFNTSQRYSLDQKKNQSVQFNWIFSCIRASEANENLRVSFQSFACQKYQICEKFNLASLIGFAKKLQT